MNKKIRASVLTIFVAAALIGSVASTGTSTAFATQLNSALQAIDQGQLNSQGTQCVAGGSDDETNGNGHDKKEQKYDKKEQKYDKKDNKKDDKRKDFNGVFASCNNVGVESQENEGKLALGQR